MTREARLALNRDDNNIDEENHQGNGAGCLCEFTALGALRGGVVGAVVDTAHDRDPGKKHPAWAHDESSSPGAFTYTMCCCGIWPMGGEGKRGACW